MWEWPGKREPSTVLLIFIFWFSNAGVDFSATFLAADLLSTCYRYAVYRTEHTLCVFHIKWTWHKTEANFVHWISNGMTLYMWTISNLAIKLHCLIIHSNFTLLSCMQLLSWTPVWVLDMPVLKRQWLTPALSTRGLFWTGLFSHTLLELILSDSC